MERKGTPQVEELKDKKLSFIKIIVTPSNECKSPIPEQEEDEEENDKKGQESSSNLNTNVIQESVQKQEEILNKKNDNENENNEENLPDFKAPPAILISRRNSTCNSISKPETKVAKSRRRSSVQFETLQDLLSERSTVIENINKSKNTLKLPSLSFSRRRSSDINESLLNLYRSRIENSSRRSSNESDISNAEDEALRFLHRYRQESGQGNGEAQWQRRYSMDQNGNAENSAMEALKYYQKFQKASLNKEEKEGMKKGEIMSGSVEVTSSYPVRRRGSVNVISNCTSSLTESLSSGDKLFGRRNSSTALLLQQISNQNRVSNPLDCDFKQDPIIRRKSSVTFSPEKNGKRPLSPKLSSSSDPVSYSSKGIKNNGNRITKRNQNLERKLPISSEVSVDFKERARTASAVSKTISEGRLLSRIKSSGVVRPNLETTGPSNTERRVQARSASAQLRRIMDNNISKSSTVDKIKVLDEFKRQRASVEFNQLEER